MFTSLLWKSMLIRLHVLLEASRLPAAAVHYCFIISLACLLDAHVGHTGGVDMPIHAIQLCSHRLELCGFGDFYFCMTREEGTGLWCFFVMLVLASAADRWVLKLLVKPDAGQWRMVKVLLCLDFRIILEEHSKFFSSVWNFTSITICPCNK